MPTKKCKGVHTSPETAGAQNMVGKKFEKDEGNLLSKILPIREHGYADGYDGKWTDEKLIESINEFFQYCEKVDLKPTQPALRVWLNISRAQFYDWKNNTGGRYSGKSDILTRALDAMEIYLQSNIDKYPTGSIFLLKSSFGHRDVSTVEVNSTPTSVEDISETVKKLGLDK